MSINATSHYMSNAEILAWMETKTDGLYEKMRTSMDTSNHRADAENALNDLKAAIDNAQASGVPPTEVNAKLHEILAKYGDEFPEIGEALQPIADELHDIIKDAQPVPPPLLSPSGRNDYDPSEHVIRQPPPAKISSDVAERWNKAIGNKVDALGKQDSLGMINIQEFNSQLNRAKDTASALMAAANKSADSIVNNIG